MIVTCIKCKNDKDISKFYVAKANSNGIINRCIECVNEDSKQYRRTKKGLISSIYGSQRRNSKQRKHDMPTYKNKDLQEWLQNDWLFNLLFNNWSNCGYANSMIPSVDRKDDSKSYTLDNIQIMTWAENRYKGRFGTGSGTPQKAVLQFTKDGILIREYTSIHEAERKTSVYNGNISRCCLGRVKTAGGFVWEHK